MIEIPLEHHHHQEQEEKEEQSQKNQTQENEEQDLPCHPHRPVAYFDNSSIEDKIRQIRAKKQAARAATRIIKKQFKQPDEIYHSNVMGDELESSMSKMPLNVLGLMKQRIKYIEDKVYVSSVNNGKGQFVSRIINQSICSPIISNQINLTFEEIHAKIESDIFDDEYQVKRIQRAKKQNLMLKGEPVKRVNYTRKVLKNKISDLRQEFNQSEHHHQPELISVGETKSQYIDEFDPHSDNTKKARDFIKKMQHKQRSIQQKKQEHNRQFQSLEVKSMMEKKQFQEHLKKEKHQSIKRRYEREREQKKLEKKKQEKNQQEYLNYMKQYKGKKPLFKIKQEQYLKNVVNVEEAKFKQVLNNIKQSRKPMSLQQIKLHEEQYLKNRAEKLEKIIQEKKFLKMQRQSHQKKQLYHGKFHSLVMEQQKVVPQDPTIKRDELIQRKRQFSVKVKKDFVPLQSEKKKKQLDEILAALQRQKSKHISTNQANALGKQIFKDFKAYIEEKRKKGLIKEQNIQEQIKENYKDYLKDIRQKKATSTIDYTTKNHNSQWLASKASKLQNQAHHQQKIMKLRGNFDFDEHMKDIREINDKYIESSQAKLNLYGNITGRRRDVSSRASSSSMGQY